MANLAENSIKLRNQDNLNTMSYYDDVSQTIGRTPLVKINRLNPYREVTILAKLEKANPGGSVKDRVAKYMIEDAEQKGIITEDTVIIEATSGNTGIGLAMMCAIKGYSCELVMPESMSIERRKIMEAYGAKVTLTSGDLGINGAQDYVRRKVSENPEKYYSPNQYDNPVNWQAHYETTALEILEDTAGHITHFVAGLGTSGTLMGVAKRLREEVPGIEIVSVEPESGQLIQGLKDLKTQYVPLIFNQAILDQRIYVDEFSAECATRGLAMDEGIFIGQSAGAAMVGALDIAREMHDEGRQNVVIVVLLADSGEKYISGSLFSTSETTESMAVKM
ncbi:MAG: cysteine synthase family protein [Candidatus Thorarchaeota archaeon]|nr:cysteine synthase family protein [Candidatus Thorarchaeota archaeon]